MGGSCFSTLTFGCSPTLHRSRSVYERALDVDPTDVKLWLSYTEMVRKTECHLLRGRVIANAGKG